MSQLVCFPYFSLFFFLYAGLAFTVAYTRGFSLNSHVYTLFYCEQSCMIWFWAFVGGLSVDGWVMMITKSSLMLLVSVYTLCFWPETAFSLFLSFVLVILLSIFCFEISALGIFYLGALLGCCLWVVAESEGGRVMFLLFYLI